MLRFTVCAGILILWTTSLAVGASSHIVDTPAGRFEGTEMTADNGQKYVGFQGIPYAKPPVGDLRLAKPVPHPKIEGTFKATLDMVLCPHPEAVFFDSGRTGQEDCLVLAIYTKQLFNDPKIKKKVLVFIHGGGFVVGGAKDYNAGTFVTEQDVILVNINYRLGVLGFLSTENEASPGNYGLWDQLLAIQWVKNNIASFGGDPDDIAIAGESAGSASVSFLSITPFAKGLFTKVFPMSGTATSVFGNALDAQLSTLRFAKKLNCWDGETDKKVGLEESQTIMKCLRTLPISQLKNFTEFSLNKAQFVPSVDGDFLPRSPSLLIKDQKYLESVGFFQRSYLFGIDNSEKAIMIHSFKMTVDFFTKMEGISEKEPSDLEQKMSEGAKMFYIYSRLGIKDPPQILVDKIMDWYDRRFGENGLAELMTDLSFLIPTYDFTDALARQVQSNVYFFYFNHYPAYMKGDFRGTPHGADLLYWFDIDFDYLGGLLQVGMTGGLNSEDLDLKSTFSSIIGDFVKAGNPAGPLKSKVPSGWPKYDLKNFSYLNVAPKLSVRSRLEEDRRELWMKTIPGWLSEFHDTSTHTEL